LTSLGHVFTGAAIGILCLPGQSTSIRKAAHLGVFALLALIPDLELPGWGHGLEYSRSHSLFVTLALILIILLVFGWSGGIRRQIGGWGMLVGGSLAWLSHLLLDSLYNHGLGVAIYWPFSTARLVLPVPWLSILPGPLLPISAANFEIIAIEALTFLPLIPLAIWLRRSRFQAANI
jgi:inner membrane protein